MRTIVHTTSRHFSKISFLNFFQVTLFTYRRVVWRYTTPPFVFSHLWQKMAAPIKNRGCVWVTLLIGVSMPSRRQNLLSISCRSDIRHLTSESAPQNAAKCGHRRLRFWRADSTLSCQSLLPIWCQIGNRWLSGYQRVLLQMTTITKEYYCIVCTFIVLLKHGSNQLMEPLKNIFLCV